MKNKIDHKKENIKFDNIVKNIKRLIIEYNNINNFQNEIDEYNFKEHQISLIKKYLLGR
jgi:hypothetical protein